MNNKKLTVGILIGNICAHHTDELLNGLLHRAEEENVQTLVFMGAHANCFDELYYYEGGNKEQKYLFQFNTVFDYAKLGKLDVLIVVYSTFYLYMEESKEEFFARFQDLSVPIIVVGDEYGNFTSVISDNYDGIEKCIKHLVEQHGCKKIGYLGGPKENNKDARERLAAYYRVMKEKKLEVLDGMVQYGDYSANSAPLFGKILDAIPDIDGVVCANDTMALSGYEECRRRGLQPGVDVAITGFDDIPEAKSANPPLTTVEQNSYVLGYLAMKKAIVLCKEQNRDSVKVPVYFKHRESCGSGKKNGNECELPENISELTKFVENSSKRIFGKVFLYKDDIVEENSIRNIIYELFYHIMRGYLSEQQVEYDVEFIDASLHMLVNSEKISVNNFIKEFCREVTNILLLGSDNKRKEQIASLMYHVIDYVQNITLIDTNHRIDTLQRNIWTTPFITRDMIANIDDDEQLYECLMERLRFMQIDNAYLFLLEKTKINQSIYQWECPKELTLVAKIVNGVILKVKEDVKLNKENGLTDILSWEECNHMGAYTLFAGKRTYGILVCEVTSDNITSMYSVSLHIGSAFQFIELTKKQRKIQAELEMAMAALKNKNDILNMISEKDELTRLYNRRGFLENAMVLMSNAKNAYLLCIYADLDHLKQINDKCGHQEGDFAIRQAGIYLKECLRSSDVIGRIGGDEFAALAVVKDENMGKEIKDRIILHSKMFNNDSDKPYYVDVSIGYAVFRWSEDLELNQMLSAADAMLYKSKAKKRKCVWKDQQ